jgi:hypothetical protein
MIWHDKAAKPLERTKIMAKLDPMHPLNAGMRAHIAEVLTEWGRAKNIKIKHIRYNSDLYNGLWRLGCNPTVTIKVKYDGTFVYHGPEHTDKQGRVEAESVAIYVNELPAFLKSIGQSTTAQTPASP